MPIIHCALHIFEYRFNDFHLGFVVYLNMKHFFQLEDWWLDAAYLELRIPSQLNVNFGGPAAYLEHCWPAREGTQLERASMVLWFTLQYWDLVRT